MLGTSRWCWSRGGGITHGRGSLPEMLLLQWKELQDKVGRLVHHEQRRRVSRQVFTETLQSHVSEPHNARKKRQLGIALKRWVDGESQNGGWSRDKSRKISDLWKEQKEQKESLQMCISRMVILPGMLLKDWWLCPSSAFRQPPLGYSFMYESMILPGVNLSIWAVTAELGGGRVQQAWGPDTALLNCSSGRARLRQESNTAYQHLAAWLASKAGF